MCAISGRRPGRPPRCSATERRRRIAAVQDAVAAGEDVSAASRRLCASWGVRSRRNAARYAAAALASWERDRRQSSRASLAASIAIRRKILRDATAAGDYSAALKAADALDRLLGVDERFLTDALLRSRSELHFAPIFEAISGALAGDPDALRRTLNAIAVAIERRRLGIDSVASIEALPSNGSLDGALTRSRRRA